MPDETNHYRRRGDIVVKDQRNYRRSYLITNGFEVAFAFAAILTVLQFILDPAVRASVAIGELGAFFSWGWTVLYFLGSIGILVGLVSVQDRIEIAGLCCFLPATLVNAAVVLGVRSPNAIYVALAFLAFTCGAGARIYLLLKLRRTLPVADTDQGR